MFGTAGSRVGRGKRQPSLAVQPGVYEAAGGRPFVADFAWINQGSASAVDGKGAIVFSAPAVAGLNFRILKRAAPPAPYSIYCRLDPISQLAASGLAGIVLRNSSNGRFLSFCDYIELSEGGVAWQRWTNPTTFSATILAKRMWKYPAWLRVDVTATTVTPYISSNGWDWVAFTTAETLSTFLTAAGGTLDEIGFGANATGIHDNYFSVFQLAAPE